MSAIRKTVAPFAWYGGKSRLSARIAALHEIAGAMVMADHVDGNAYQVLGNKRERMAQYGNAVTPPAARELILRVLEVLA